MASTDLLSKLPGELIDNICTYLGRGDIHALRTTCATMKEKSHSGFAACHFRTTRVMLTRESLEALIALAKDERFRASIQVLQLCMVIFLASMKFEIDDEVHNQHEREELELACAQAQCHEEAKHPKVEDDRDHHIKQEAVSVTEPVKGLSSQPYSTSKDSRQFQSGIALTEPAGVSSSQLSPTPEGLRRFRRLRRQRYGRHMHSQNTLRTKSIDVELLAEAFRNLPALQSVVITNQLNRDRPPLGLRKVVSEIGMWPVTASLNQSIELPRVYWTDYAANSNEIRASYRRFISHGIAVTCGAILRSKIKLKQSFTVDGASYNFRLSKTPESRKLGPTTTPAKTFAQSQIKELKQAFSDVQNLSFHFHEHRQNDSIPGLQAPFAWFKSFIPLFPSVRTLSLTGETLRERNVSIFSELFTSPDVFPKLEALHISSSQAQLAALVQTLANRERALKRLVVCDGPKTCKWRLSSACESMH
ncbi:hypothetical protein BDV95DRAFT_609782 [Massariosphaeria phaeospora]|uniref:F-box domain-containing protein n=1 Tax=Massariosphaeria phaeospora TaxID=100035 RepID=A0A7C8I1F7_9PLEO|nr:hypothetical protein BDV95DRAFT_609782 [Massariosphaeria phaeospora]